jgi:serine/threonine protein kinase
MEYLHGVGLRALQQDARTSGEPVPIDVVVAVGLAIADALAYAHAQRDEEGQSQRLVHRDVSPANVVLTFEGEVKLIDFGIAKARGRMSYTEVGEVKGKYAYMSPEQIRALPVDKRSDIFSLGVCLWELLANRSLFGGGTDIDVIERVRACAIPSLLPFSADMPQEIDRIVRKALAKEPDDRYASASDLFADLNAFAHIARRVEPGGGLPVGSTSRRLVEAYVRRRFAEEAASKSIQESRTMSDKSGGSDLDVFEGLAKKSSGRPSGIPLAPASKAPPPPPPASLRGGKTTMLGIAPPANPPPSAVVNAPASTPSKAPPPPLNRSSTAAMPAVNPPPATRNSVLPPPTAPAASRALPPVLPPPTASKPPPPLASASLLPPVSAPPPKAPVVKASDVEMDWDDDEKTSILDKATEDELRPGGSVPPPPSGGPRGDSRPSLGAAAKLAAGSGGAASIAPPPPASAAPAAALPAPTPPPAKEKVKEKEREPATSRQDPTQMVRPQRGNSNAVVGLVGAIVVLGGLAWWLLQPTTGTVIVNVKSGTHTVENARVFVDDKEMCQRSPCKVADVPKGTRTVKVEADGYSSNSDLVPVRAGEEQPVTIQVEATGKGPAQPASTGAAPQANGTGFKVGGPSFIKLSVDGKEIGPLPQDVKNLTPGDHKIKLVGGDRYATEERTLSVKENEIQTLPDAKLKVVKGRATLTLDTPGAVVTLVSGSERKAVGKLPISIDIDTSKQWTIEANKTGFEHFSQPISFDDGEAEKTFAIALTEKGKVAKPDPKEKTTAASTKDPKETKETKETPKEATGNGTLSVNSIPPSAVLVDGRPVGMTPKGGISVSAGSHSVVFKHPEKGTKGASVTIKAGESKSVSVRFD